MIPIQQAQDIRDKMNDRASSVAGYAITPAQLIINDDGEHAIIDLSGTTINNVEDISICLGLMELTLAVSSNEIPSVQLLGIFQYVEPPLEHEEAQKFVDYLNQLATTWSGETKVIVEVKDKCVWVSGRPGVHTKSGEEFQKMGTPPKQLFEKLFGDKV